MENQKNSEKNIFVEPRNRLIGWVRKQLIGPPDPPKNEGPNLVGVLPTERFPCGALYPISPAGEGIDPAGDDGSEDDTVPNATGETKEEPAVVRRYIPPSSLGLSFFIKGEDTKTCTGKRTLLGNDVLGARMTKECTNDIGGLL